MSNSSFYYWITLQITFIYLQYIFYLNILDKALEEVATRNMDALGKSSQYGNYVNSIMSN